MRIKVLTLLRHLSNKAFRFFYLPLSLPRSRYLSLSLPFLFPFLAWGANLFCSVWD